MKTKKDYEKGIKKFQKKLKDCHESEIKLFTAAIEYYQAILKEIEKRSVQL